MKKNTITIIMCLNQSTVKITRFWLNSQLKDYLTDRYETLQEKVC